MHRARCYHWLLTWPCGSLQRLPEWTFLTSLRSNKKMRISRARDGSELGKASSLFHVYPIALAALVPGFGTRSRRVRNFFSHVGCCSNEAQLASPLGSMVPWNDFTTIDDALGFISADFIHISKHEFFSILLKSDDVNSRVMKKALAL